MKLEEMLSNYQNEGLSYSLASARVCQDVILKAISDSPLDRNVTIKGGVVMQSITKDIRRATRDIDLDFIHYPITDEAIRSFIKKVNASSAFSIDIDGNIEELNHQDYHGKRVKIIIKDSYGKSINSKIDIGVHKHFDIEQEEYCFDVCLDDEGASLLKNSIEQSIAEKLRSLLIFGANSRRYKDVFDIHYGLKIANKNRLKKIIDAIIIKDDGMREKTHDDIIKRLKSVLRDKEYLDRVSASKQRWFDEDIEIIARDIIDNLIIALS